MTTWHLTGTADEQRQGRWQRLPRSAMAEMTGPEGYRTHPALIDAINVALALGQPLLVTGEPGCGKTELGNYVAWALDLGKAIRFDTKSTMTSRDLFYQFDTLGRFHAAQMERRDTDPNKYIAYQALGLAILYAKEPAEVADVVNDRFEHPGRRRSVVLIDEVDKAPRDVPNDLLAELENMRFFIPELDRSVEADPSMRPILVITSNSEKALPDAFLRRCVYYHIPFPANDDLQEIVAARIPALPKDSDLLGDVLTLFGFVRSPRQQLRKNPGTAELLNFLLVLRDRGYEPADSLRGSKRLARYGAVDAVQDARGSDRRTRRTRPVQLAAARELGPLTVAALAALPTPGELAAFFGELRQAGYRWDPRQLSAAERLLLMAHSTEQPPDPARLKTLLAPVFVNSPAQQADFYARFEAWLARRGGGPVGIEPDATLSERDVRRERRWRWRLVAGAGVLLVAIGVGTWSWLTVEEKLEPGVSGVTETPPAAQPPAPETPTAAPAKPKDNTVYLIEDKPRPFWAAMQTVLTALPLLALLVWIGISWTRRRLWLERWTSGTVPELDRLRLPRSSRGLFGAPGFRFTAQNLRRHRRVPATGLDIRKTIEATVAQAGLFTPIGTERPLTPEYLFLVDEMAADDHVARLADEALNRLEDEGVAVERCYYSRDPRVCFHDDERRTPVVLSELAGRTAGRRLVVIGTADGFFHPVSGRLEKWVSGLAAWPGRVMMSPRPLRHWSMNELALLEDGFSLATTTPKGFGALGDYVSTVEEASGGELLEGTLVAAPSGAARLAGWRVEALAPPGLEDLLPQLEALSERAGGTPLKAALAALIDALARPEAGPTDAERALSEVHEHLSKSDSPAPSAPKLLDWIGEYLARRTQAETEATITPSRQEGHPEDRVDAGPAEPDLVVCYTGKDRLFGQHLCTDLRGRGVSVFELYHDTFELPAVQDDAEADRLLQERTPLAVVLSEHALVDQRLTRAVDGARKYGSHVVPVLPSRPTPSITSKPIARLQWIEAWDADRYRSGLDQILAAVRGQAPQPEQSFVYLGYAREDADTARGLLDVLTREGVPIWGDWKLTAGEPWLEVIEGQVAKASVVLVLLTRRSIEKEWIQKYMYLAKERGTLIPVQIDRGIQVAEYLQRQVQVMDLSDWSGASDDPAFQALLTEIRRRLRQERGRRPIEVPDFAVFRDVDAPWFPEMVALPAGKFRMGSPKEEKGRWDPEGPRHQVRIGYRLAMGRYPVTFDEYDHFCAATKRAPPRDRGWGRGKRPVIFVNWGDAVAYCEWLAKETGKPYRLPSEAEWEYACRAGTTTRYSWGDGITEKDANYHDSKLGKTTEVGRYPANPWGLYDMLGNVEEWVQDVWHPNYKGQFVRGLWTDMWPFSYKRAPADGSAWIDRKGQESSPPRVLRGSSWSSNFSLIPNYIGSAARSWCGHDNRYAYIGFRVARTLE